MTTENLPHLCLEFGDRDGRCRACGTPTKLVTAAGWVTHNDESSEDVVEPHGEVSGSYCPACNRLTAIHLHHL